VNREQAIPVLGVRSTHAKRELTADVSYNSSFEYLCVLLRYLALSLTSKCSADLRRLESFQGGAAAET
jgi:hypothetical protein